MKKSMKKRSETKSLCRELHAGELEQIDGGVVVITDPGPKDPGPK